MRIFLFCFLDYDRVTIQGKYQLKIKSNEIQDKTYETWMLNTDFVLDVLDVIL